MLETIRELAPGRSAVGVEETADRELEQQRNGLRRRAVGQLLERTGQAGRACSWSPNRCSIPRQTPARPLLILPKNVKSSSCGASEEPTPGLEPGGPLHWRSTLETAYPLLQRKTWPLSRAESGSFCRVGDTLRDTPPGSASRRRPRTHRSSISEGAETGTGPACLAALSSAARHEEYTAISTSGRQTPHSPRLSGHRRTRSHTRRNPGRDQPAGREQRRIDSVREVTELVDGDVEIVTEACSAAAASVSPRSANWSAARLSRTCSAVRCCCTPS